MDSKPLHDDFDGYLYHATAAHNLDAILAHGLNAGSYLGTGDIIDYYAETIEDEGHSAVVIKVLLADLSGRDFAPDQAGLEEPICTIVGKSEDEIWEEWRASAQTWQDCFRIIGSLKTNAVIPAGHISLDENC